MLPHPRLRPVYLVLALAACFAAACAPLPPVIRGPDASTLPATNPAAVAASPTADVGAQATAIQATSVVTETVVIRGTEVVSNTSGVATAAPLPAMNVITGQVTYRQRIALAPDAVVEVELQDISRADVPATIIGSQRIETQGKQVPIPYAIEYDLSQIDPAGVYSIRARIIEGGLVTWLTTDAPRVITRGAPTDQVEVVVQQSSNPQPAAGAAARLNGVVTYLQRIALSPDAVVEVSLQDISRADAPAVVVASQTIQTGGKQVPIPFALDYDPGAIDPRMSYAVSARITENGQLTWISTQVYPVLTRGAPSDNVEIIVDRVQRG